MDKNKNKLIHILVNFLSEINDGAYDLELYDVIEVLDGNKDFWDFCVEGEADYMYSLQQGISIIDKYVEKILNEKK